MLEWRGWFRFLGRVRSEDCWERLVADDCMLIPLMRYEDWCWKW